MKRLALGVLFLAAAGRLTAADAANVVATIPGYDGANVVRLSNGTTVPAQPDGEGLTFVVPAAAGRLTAAPATVNYAKAPTAFRFAEEAGKHVDVLHGDRKVIRYMNAPRDGSSKDAHELTFKPFHHVFDPAKGETLLTNGAGLAANKDLLFPHHRGLFFAFNKISYDGAKPIDTWHGRNGEYTLHEKMLATEAGEVFARHRAQLSWHGQDGKAFADEKRAVTVYNAAGGTLIDWSSELTTKLPKVRLDGDPQHAGFHFRAAMEVSKNGKANTYYLRPDGKGKPGETRNWEPKTKKGPTNLPWDACSFVVGEKRYTVLRMAHPDNPKETRGSERDYGRFGDYFEYDLTPATPLRLKYRVWVQAGELTGEQAAAMHRGFAEPPAVTVK